MNWHFDIVKSDWIGGHISNRNRRYKSNIRMCVNSTKLKNGTCNYRVFLHKNGDRKKRLEETFIERSKFDSDEEQLTKRDEVKLEYLKRICHTNNCHRIVVYKGHDCIEMKLDKGKSVLIEKDNLDAVNKYCWCTSSNDRYAIRTDKKLGKIQYLHKYLYSDPDVIITFKDDNPLNCLKSNILDSGKKKTIVTPEIIKYNHKITTEYLNYLKRQRAIQRELYTVDGRFKFDEVLSKWYMSYDGLKIINRNNQMQFWIPFNNKYKIFEKIEFDEKNKKQKIEEAKKLKKLLLSNYDCSVNNPYRYVIFNGIKCVEMELVGNTLTPHPISVIFDIKHLNWIKEHKWRPNKSGQLWRAVDTKNKKYMHRLIVDEKWEKVDHIDGYEINNLESNLRDGTKNNMLNQRLNSRNKTGINGVHWDVSQNRYRFKWFINGTECETQFPAGIWRSVENAFCAAVAFKVKKDKELGNTNGIRL